METVTVGEIIRDLCKGWSIEKKLKEHNVIIQWPSIVGDKIAKEAKPLCVRGGKLFLYVEKAVWRNELTFMKREIIQKLNQTAGTSLIQEIVFSTRKGANHLQ